MKRFSDLTSGGTLFFFSNLNNRAGDSPPSHLHDSNKASGGFRWGGWCRGRTQRIHPAAQIRCFLFAAHHHQGRLLSPNALSSSTCVVQSVDILASGALVCPGPRPSPQLDKRHVWVEWSLLTHLHRAAQDPSPPPPPAISLQQLLVQDWFFPVVKFKDLPFKREQGYDCNEKRLKSSHVFFFFFLTSGTSFSVLCPNVSWNSQALAFGLLLFCAAFMWTYPADACWASSDVRTGWGEGPPHTESRLMGHSCWKVEKRTSECSFHQRSGDWSVASR